MPNHLEDIIKTHIEHHGPMPIDQYWTLCLAHPEYGYYIKKDPLGCAGDFTTAPEISQLFGEMIGIWAAEQWNHIGKPEKIHIVECGPGRGTLMADMLRIANIIPEFAAAVHVHLVETSPALREKQKQAVKGWHVTWHNDFSTIPQDDPVLIIGNEFLDALPIKQFIKKENGWHERCIATSNDELVYVLGGKITASDFPKAYENDIYEISPNRESVFQQMLAKIKNQSGAILMIDYGHLVSAVGNTFQAIKNHEFTDPLQNQGDADLTSHVDFGKLSHIASTEGLAVRLGTQGQFLDQMGIKPRAEQLKKAASKTQIADIESALNRLMEKAEMGELFKIIEVSR